MISNRSIEFFEQQFQRQAREGDFALNPFEVLALPYLSGRLLDLGCGLGNMTLEAARRGGSVLALDGSPRAILCLLERARAEGLMTVEAHTTDLAAYRIPELFDTIVAVGLLMFFPKPVALEMLEDLKAHVRPGGCAVVNVLTVGTTYLEMFEPDHYYLFGQSELEMRFAGWEILASVQHSFDAPASSRKIFSTVIARKKELLPASGPEAS